jgi:hypothetical protein
MSRKMVFGRYDYAAFGTFIAYAVGSLVVPVALFQIAPDLGFTLDEGGTSRGGWLHMMRCVSICATRALSGFMAGRWGNRRPLGVSVALIGAGLLVTFTSPVLVIVAPGLYVWLSSYMLMRIFKRYRPEMDKDPMQEIAEIEAAMAANRNPLEDFQQMEFSRIEAGEAKMEMEQVLSEAAGGRAEPEPDSAEAAEGLLDGERDTPDDKIND